MTTNAAVEGLLYLPPEQLLTFFKTIEKKILIDAFFNLNEEQILKLEDIFPQDDRFKLKEAWSNAIEPSPENRWAAQKTIVVLFQRYKSKFCG